MTHARYWLFSAYRHIGRPAVGAMARGNLWPHEPQRRGQSIRWHRTPVELGDWVITNRSGDSRCRIYSAPPGQNARDFDRITEEQGTYLGPVLEVQHTHKYVSIRVPVNPLRWYCASTMGWVNIWKVSQPRHLDLGIRFAQVVSAEQRQRWRERGWYDQYCDPT